MSAYKRFDRWLAGAPDTAIVAGLLAVAGVATAAALLAPRPMRAVVLAWFALP